jgi:hypothetical protein
LRSAVAPGPLDRFEVQTDTEVVELRSDGFIYLFWQPNRIVEATNALAAVAAVKRMLRGRGHPLLVDVSRTEVVRHDARSVLARPWPASRVALLGSRPADKFVATLFLRAGTALHPTRFFTSRTAAMNWLSQGCDGRPLG